MTGIASGRAEMLADAWSILCRTEQIRDPLRDLKHRECVHFNWCSMQILYIRLEKEETKLIYLVMISYI